MNKLLQELITQAEIANINGDNEAVKILLQAHTILFRAFKSSNEEHGYTYHEDDDFYVYKAE